MSESGKETGTEAPWLNGAERGILTHFGHMPDPAFNEEKLARRVLEFPNTAENWYAASAVTLAAAYLDPKRLAAPALYESELKLCNEVAGIIDNWEAALRGVMGNTNFNVLKLRYDEARSALLLANTGGTENG